MVSRTGKTRWELFPVGTEGEVLSEADFQNFVQHYLAQ
ncbi:SinI family restriction endonuclease [uncultured Varibaculum sp.]